MKQLKYVLMALAMFAGASQAQTALTQTTLSAAVSATANVFPLTAVTGITTSSLLYVIDYGEIQGELMSVRAVNTSTNRVTVVRGPGVVTAHASGARVVIAPVANAFQTSNPQGACTAANTQYTPWINTTTGEQWICSTVSNVWVPGFARRQNAVGVTATVASAAGFITPSGPLFTMSGTAAITGITQPVGYAGGQFCVMPSGAFTTTTANNIAIASTAVVGRILCFDYNPTTDKFHPSY